VLYVAVGISHQATNTHNLSAGTISKDCSTLADVAVLDDGLALEFGERRVSLIPSEGFALAERLIRGATRAIVQDEANHAVVSAALNSGGRLTSGRGA
jgi:hypothetical protein